MKKYLFIPLLLAATGCGTKTLPPYNLDEIPVAIQKAFKTASPELKRTVEVVVMQVQHKQFSPAAMQLEVLVGNRGLNTEQQTTAARALMTVNGHLQEQLQIQEAAVAASPNTGLAQSAPKPKPPDPETAAAAAVMDRYIRTK